MAKESCINHPSNSKVVVLREYYVKICSKADSYKRADRYCAALLLSQFEYWMNVKMPNKKQAEFENKLAEKEDLEPSQNEDLWVWKTQDDLTEELFDMYSSKKIGHSLQWLVDNKLLLRRKNPKYKWDNTYQYIINTKKVQKKINDQISLNSSNSNMPGTQTKNVSTEGDNMSDSRPTNVSYEADKCLSHKRQMSETIPESTTKITSKNRTFSPAKQDDSTKNPIKPPFKKIINYFNKTTNRKYSSKTKETRKLIRILFETGYKFEDLQEVIDKKYKEWSETKFEKYLRPKTLFKLENFEDYLNQPWPAQENNASMSIKEMERQGWNQ